MDELIKKVNKIKNMLPSPNTPQAAEAQPAVQPEQAPKPVTTTPSSKKDPKKVAEQLEDSDFRDQTLKQARKLKEGIRESVSFNSLGQWKIK